MDLAEEHSSATLANQRLKMESVEKMRLEKELDEMQVYFVIFTQIFN